MCPQTGGYAGGTLEELDKFKETKLAYFCAQSIPMSYVSHAGRSGQYTKK